MGKTLDKFIMPFTIYAITAIIPSIYALTGLCTSYYLNKLEKEKSVQEAKTEAVRLAEADKTFTDRVTGLGVRIAARDYIRSHKREK